MTAPASDRGDNTARVEELRARILATPFPLGRGCCGADSPSDCHQRGLCWMEGTHPDSPGYRPAPAADRQTDEEPPLSSTTPCGTCGHQREYHVARVGRCPVVVQFDPTATCGCHQFAARPAVADAVMADLGVAITEGVTEVRLREAATEIVANLVLASKQTVVEDLGIGPLAWGDTAARQILALPEMRALLDAAAKVQRVEALIAHVDSGIVSVAAVRHALTGEPMPDGQPDDLDALAARIAALRPGGTGGG